MAEPPAPDEFARRLASASPTPGGGAAAARVGQYATSLLSMAAAISRARAPRNATGSEAAALRELGEIESGARALAQRFAELERADIRAFDAFIAALRLPRATGAEEARRSSARREAARRASEAPLESIEAALECARLVARLEALSGDLKIRAESDLAAAVELARAASRAAELNVRVNLPELEGTEPGSVVRARLEDLLGRLESEVEPLLSRLRRGLGAR